MSAEDVFDREWTDEELGIYPPRTYTDAELTRIYNEANGIGEGKSPPITTQRIFAAMRAMLPMSR